MPGGTVVTENQEDEKNKLNNTQGINVNRGFELMLKSKRREKKSEPKTFQFGFGKMISLLNREIHFNFNLDFNIKKIK